jgi:hypothetical protein
VVETDLSSGNHIVQSLFAHECVLQNKGNGHGWLTPYLSSSTTHFSQGLVILVRPACGATPSSDTNR